MHDAGADRDRDRLGAVVRPELLEDALEVGLDGVRRDAQIARDLPGGGAVGHLLEDLPLAFGQRRGPGLVARGLGLLDEGLRELGWITALPSTALRAASTRASGEASFRR